MAGLIRDRGRTAFELEQERVAGSKGIPDSAQPLAEDYEVLVTQIFQRAAELRKAA